MDNPIEEYLTAEKAAAILDVTPQMIRKLCRSGQLPFCQVGRCIRIARPDFDGYLASQRIGGQLPGLRQGARTARNCGGSTELTVARGRHAC